VKKIFLTICLLLIFNTTTANAYTAFIGIDDTFDLTSVVGFYFEVPDASYPLDLTVYYQGDTIGMCGENRDGAVPGDSIVPWYIGPLSTNPVGAFIGIDMPPVLSTGDNSPLSPGIILSLEADTPFSLENFILAGMHPDGELYLYDFNIVEIFPEGCTEGAKEYIYSAVPIPGSLILLGSGLIGLIGLGRRRMMQ
jgi:hypothetical protein